MKKVVQTVDFPTRLLLLMPPAFLIGIKYDLPHVFILTFLFTLLPFAIKPLKISLGKIILLLPLVFLLVFIPDSIFQTGEDRMALNDIVLRTHFFVPLLLYITGIMCAMHRTRELCGFIALICIFCMLICNDIYNTRGIVNIRFPFTTELLQNYRITHWSMTFLQGIGLLLLLISDARTHAIDRSGKIWYYRLAAFLLCPILLFAMYRFYNENLNNFKNFQRELYRNMRRMHRFRHSKQNSTLNISNPRALTGTLQDNTVLIRVYSTTPPGYLRGRSYDQYSPGGIWRTSQNTPEPEKLPDLALDKELAVSYYPFTGDSRERQKEKWEIYLSSTFFTDYLPIPGNTLAVEMVSESASLTADGVLLPKKHSNSAGYTVFMEKTDMMSASPFPDLNKEPSAAKRYLHIPPEMKMNLNAFLQTLFPAGLEEQSQQQIIHRIVQYLQKNFVYSLNPKPAGLFRFIHTKEPPSDPVERFLLYTRSGHCELFASAAVLLLRTAGIPARYITGFICDDRHDAGYYYSTARNAHAWLEVYNNDLKSWQAYDPTPPDTTGRMTNPVPGSIEVFFAKINHYLRKSLAFLFRGYPVKYFNRGISAVSDFILFLFTTVKGAVYLLIFFLLTAVFCGLYIRKKYNRNNMQRELKKLQKLLQRLQRMTGTARTSGETWMEWCAHFNKENWYDSLLQLLMEYEQMRYSGNSITPEQIRNFEQKANDLKQCIKKH